MPSESDAPTRTVVVWCADWPAVALGRPVDRPVVVMFANRVVATNPLARALGVDLGVRRREAQRHCPEAELVERDADREARTFEPVVAALDDITPRIEIVRPGSCLFPARGPSRYFGGDAELADRLTRAVRRQLVIPTAVGVGIADGAFAATLAAKRSAGMEAGGTDVSVIVPPGETPGFLAEFGVGALQQSGPSSPDLVEVLVRLGITTLGSLSALAASDVVARFGAEGAEAHRLARGLDLRPPRLADPPVDLDVSHEPDPPLERVDQAAFVAKALADDLHERLGSRGLAAVAILIEATTTEGHTVERRWRHDGALSSTAVAQRVRWQLDGWLTSTQGRRSRGAGALARLRVRPTEVVPDVGRQMGFWGGADAASIRARRGHARRKSLTARKQPAPGLQGQASVQRRPRAPSSRRTVPGHPGLGVRHSGAPAPCAAPTAKRNFRRPWGRRQTSQALPASGAARLASRSCGLRKDCARTLRSPSGLK